MNRELTEFKTLPDLMWDIKRKGMTDLISGIRLVPFTATYGQLDRVMQWSLDREVNKYYVVGKPMSEAEFLMVYQVYPVVSSVAAFEIINKEDTPVGFANIAFLDKPMPVTAIIIGDKSQWGRGIGYRTVSMLHMRMKEAGYRKAIAQVYGDNIESINIYRGFVPNVKVVGRDPDILELTMDLTQWQPAHPIQMVVG